MHIVPPVLWLRFEKYSMAEYRIHLNALVTKTKQARREEQVKQANRDYQKNACCCEDLGREVGDTAGIDKQKKTSG